jgi:hypothetical protein
LQYCLSVLGLPFVVSLSVRVPVPSQSATTIDYYRIRTNSEGVSGVSGVSGERRGGVGAGLVASRLHSHVSLNLTDGMATTPVARSRTTYIVSIDSWCM